LEESTNNHREAQKEADRDLWEQKNDNIQTLLTSASVLFGMTAAIIIEGTLPANSDEALQIAFMAGTGMSFGGLFLCIVSSMLLNSRMSEFMQKRVVAQRRILGRMQGVSHELYNDLQKLNSGNLDVFEYRKMDCSLKDKRNQLNRLGATEAYVITGPCASQAFFTFEGFYEVNCLVMELCAKSSFCMSTFGLLVALACYTWSTYTDGHEPDSVLGVSVFLQIVACSCVTVFVLFISTVPRAKTAIGKASFLLTFIFLLVLPLAVVLSNMVSEELRESGILESSEAVGIAAVPVCATIFGIMSIAAVWIQGWADSKSSFRDWEVQASRRTGGVFGRGASDGAELDIIKLKQRWDRLFDVIDDDKSGTLEQDEIRKFFKTSANCYANGSLESTPGKQLTKEYLREDQALRHFLRQVILSEAHEDDKYFKAKMTNISSTNLKADKLHREQWMQSYKQLDNNPDVLRLDKKCCRKKTDVCFKTAGECRQMKLDRSDWNKLLDAMVREQRDGGGREKESTALDKEENIIRLEYELEVRQRGGGDGGGDGVGGGGGRRAA
jgi:hypothetical protein